MEKKGGKDKPWRCCSVAQGMARKAQEEQTGRDNEPGPHQRAVGSNQRKGRNYYRRHLPSFDETGRPCQKRWPKQGRFRGMV